MADGQFSTSNKILASLKPAALDLLVPHLKLVELPLRTELEKKRAPIKKVYFMESGMASVVDKVRTKDIEIGIIGREGMTGLSLVMGAPLPMQDIFIQIAGSAHAIAADRLRRAMTQNPDLQKAFLLYAYSFSLQAGQTAAANGHGKLEERLARWLLMAHDRVEGDDVSLTHEFMAMMLGVRRAGVSVALQHLADAGLIDTERRVVIITNRRGLEKSAQGIYRSTSY